MRAGLENSMVKRAAAAVLLSGLLLIAGATSAGAQGYGGDSGYGTSYPLSSTPASPGQQAETPPTLARTGSDSAGFIVAAAGVLLLGGGLVVVARRRKLGGLITT